MKTIFLAAAAAACMVTAAAAQLPPAEAAAKIRARQHNYKQMAAAVRSINEQLRSGAPVLAEIRTRSRLIAGFAPQLLRWFPRGTGPEAGVRTRALPTIWSNHRAFTRAGAVLVVASRNFDRAARGGDVAAIRAAWPAVTRACAGCHDDFRAEEH